LQAAHRGAEALGSDRNPAIVSDHEVIFEHLVAVTSGALLFSNCESFTRCPAWIRENASAEQRADYTSESLRRATSKWFEIEEHKRLGKRHLWLGHPKITDLLLRVGLDSAHHRDRQPRFTGDISHDDD
jgi:hypothetical protein